MYLGLASELVGRAKAASWNGPTMLPRVIHPRSPYKHKQYRSELVGRAKAASWNGPTILPRVIHPRSPYKYI